MAILRPNAGNVLAGVFTFYLVATAVLTVRRPVMDFQRIDALALLVALAVAVTGVTFAFEALGNAGGTKGGIPAPVFFMFGILALVAAAGDIRVMWARRIEGTPRFARHLWRMCFAFWIATASFFLGPSWLPPPLRLALAADPRAAGGVDHALRAGAGGDPATTASRPSGGGAGRRRPLRADAPRSNEKGGPRWPPFVCRGVGEPALPTMR